MDKPLFMGKVSNKGTLAGEGGSGDSMVATGSLRSRPNFTAGPTRGTISGDTIPWTATSDTNGTIYLVGIEQGNLAPDPEDVVNGFDSTGELLAKYRESVACTAGQSASLTVTGVTEAFLDFYFAIKGADGLVSFQAVKRSVTVNNGLPPFWTFQNVGSAVAGTAGSFANGIFTVKGNGGTLGPAPDRFSIIHRPANGAVRFYTQLLSVSGGTGPRAGIMVRAGFSPEADDAFLALFYTSTGRRVIYRTSKGAAITSLPLVTSSIPRYIEIDVSSGNIIAYAIREGGTDYETVAQAQVILGAPFFVGLIALATDSIAEARFADVKLEAMEQPNDQAPAFVGSLQASNIEETSFDLPFQLTASGEARAVVTSRGDDLPDRDRVWNGLDARGNEPISRDGPVPAPPNTPRILTLAGLTKDTPYDWHAIAKGNNGILQAAPFRGQVRTKAPPPPPPPPPPPGEGCGERPRVPSNERVKSIIQHYTSPDGSGLDKINKDWSNGCGEDGDGNLYMMWLDSNENVRVVKLPQGGGQPIVSGVIAQMGNDNHYVPSFGIDKSGIGHILLNLHNKFLGGRPEGWCKQGQNTPTTIPAYFRMAEKGNVNSFEAIGVNRHLEWPTGRGTTYVHFNNDPGNNLYLTYRATTGENATGGNGWRQLSVDKWVPELKRWQICGGTNYRWAIRHDNAPVDPFDNSATFWNDTGAMRETSKASYNQYQARITWDCEGNMYLGFDLYGIGSALQQPSDSLAMWSDDKPEFKKWKRLDGGLISAMPAGFESPSGHIQIPASQRATHLARAAEDNILVHCGRVYSGGILGIYWAGGYKGKLYEDGQVISVSLPTGGAQEAVAFSRHGIVTCFNGNTAYRSYNGGRNWKAVQGSFDIGGNMNLDYGFNARHNDRIRFRTKEGVRYVMRTVILEEAA